MRDSLHTLFLSTPEINLICMYLIAKFKLYCVTLHTDYVITEKLQFSNNLIL